MTTANLKHSPNGNLLFGPNGNLVINCVCSCTVTITDVCGYTLTPDLTPVALNTYHLKSGDTLTIDFPNCEAGCCDPARLLDHIEVNEEEIEGNEITCNTNCDAIDVVPIYNNDGCQGSLTVSGACEPTVTGACSTGSGTYCFDPTDSPSVTFPATCNDCPTERVLTDVTQTGSFANCDGVSISATYTLVEGGIGSCWNLPWFTSANGWARNTCRLGGYGTCDQWIYDYPNTAYPDRSGEGSCYLTAGSWPFSVILLYPGACALEACDDITIEGVAITLNTCQPTCLATYYKSKRTLHSLTTESSPATAVFTVEYWESDWVVTYDCETGLVFTAADSLSLGQNVYIKHEYVAQFQWGYNYGCTTWDIQLADDETVTPFYAGVSFMGWEEPPEC